MRLVARLTMTVVNLRQVAFDGVAKERFDGRQQFRLVVLDRHDVLTLALGDLLHDLSLATHRVDGDDGVRQLDLLQQLGNCRDFVGFLFGRDLAQRDPFFAGPGADDVQGAQAFGRVMRAAATLAVDRDQDLASRRSAAPATPPSRLENTFETLPA